MFALRVRPLRPSPRILPAATRCMGHTVRIIVREDLPHGHGYKNDVVTVKAGYARNFLIPKKMAVYATREKFKLLGLNDPDQETYEQQQQRLHREASADNKDVKAYDMLKTYLRNKVLKMWRNVDVNSPDGKAIAPGHVDHKAIREKLSKQLKIDLFRHEKVHLRPEPVVFTELSEKDLEAIMEELGGQTTPCDTKVRHLGEYVACISLRGGYKVPLKVEVLKR